MAKFKKLALVSSAILMTTAFAFGVAACGEEACAHTYEKKSDETHTWYECTQENCDSVVGKEEIHVHNYVKKNDETHTWYECDAEGCDSVVAKEAIVTPHVHTFALKKNDSKHWYECSDENCTEKVGEANHVWNDGEETLAPEVGVAGEYTYTCRVCGKTDVDPVDALTPNPLIVAEGSIVVKNNYSGGDTATVAMEAGSYIIIAEADREVDAYSLEVGYDSSWSNTLQFEVAEAGDVEISFQAYQYLDSEAPDYAEKSQQDVTVNYVIKKVPSITPDVSEMEGTEEIVTYAWVKVNVEIPVAGKFAIGSENALFSEYAGGGDSIYVFTTTEANETVTFYAKALDDSEEKATVSYEVAQLQATKLTMGANVVELWGFTGTDVTFTAPAAGAYKFVTFDDTFAVYKEYPWDLCSELNGIYYFEAEEANQTFSFAVTGIYNVATFAIAEFPDEERYTSVVTFDQETGAGYANLKAGSTANFNLPTMGTYALTWESTDLVVNVGGIAATTQNVVFACSRNNPLTVTVKNNASEDIEDTFSLTALNGTDGVVAGSVEVYVSASGGSPMNTVSLPVQLSAGSYFVSVSSSTITSATYNDTALCTTAVEVTATGDIDTLSILNSNDAAEMVVVTIVVPGSAECPIVVDVNETYENIQLAVVEQNFFGSQASSYFSYTATADGTMTISGVSGYTVTPKDDSFEMSDYDETMCTFEVTSGTTYVFSIGQQDSFGSPISPAFAFTAANA